MKRLLFLFIALVGAAWSCGAAGYFPTKATFYGLFFESNGYWEQSAGTVTITTTATGRFSGNAQLGPFRYPFSGFFDNSGAGEAYSFRRFGPGLEILLQVDSEDPDVIYGTISNGAWTADVIADRAVFDGRSSVSYDEGQYTMILPGNFTSAMEPGGDSYGTIKVDRSGRLRFSGSLADGTRVSQGAYVSQGGQWPFFVSLYKGGGAAYGWLLLNPSLDEALSGEVTWIRPEIPWSQYYPRGFAVILSAWGSWYDAAGAATRILDLDEGKIEFNGGSLFEGITNRFRLEYKNKVTNLSANPLSLKFNRSTGMFSGRVIDPRTWRPVSFGGVVLQDYNVAGGYFLGRNNSGEVWLSPEE